MGGMHITMTLQSVQRADSTQLPEVMTPTAESGSGSQLTSSEGWKVGGGGCGSEQFGIAWQWEILEEES